MRLFGRALLLPLFLIFVLLVAALIIAGMGVYGTPVAIVAAVLVLSSRRFREWLLEQPGYQKRLQPLRYWADYSPALTALSFLLYMLPMSLLCAVVLLMFVRTPLALGVVATGGLAGIFVLYLDAVVGMGLTGRTSRVVPPVPDFWRFCGRHKFASTCIVFGTAVPLIAVVLLASSIWLPTTSAARIENHFYVPETVHLVVTPSSTWTAVPSPTSTSTPTSTGTSTMTATPLPSPTATRTPTVTWQPPFHNLTPFPTVTPSPEPMDAFAPEAPPFLPPPIRSS